MPYPKRSTATQNEHEWVDAKGDLATHRITDYGSMNWGDVVFVELPKPGATRTGKPSGPWNR